MQGQKPNRLFHFCSIQFSLIHSFDVFEFESLYSDAHCAVMLSINILSNPIKIGQQQVNDPNPKPRLWDDRKGALFVKNLNYKILKPVWQI